MREICLSDVIHQAIADNKYLLLRNNMKVTISNVDHTVFSDDKWVRFILNQLIVNAVKYRTEQPELDFHVRRQGDQVMLDVADNGIGIPACDLPRIFEKGFTGQNGRTTQNSTGIGLYLCKKLCDKIGIGISADSRKAGTSLCLTFRINHFVHEVQD